MIVYGSARINSRHRYSTYKLEYWRDKVAQPKDGEARTDGKFYKIQLTFTFDLYF